MYFNLKLWALTQGVRKRILAAVVMGLGSSILGIARLVALAWLLAQLFNGVAWQQLLWPALGITVLMLSRGAWDYWRANTAHETAARVQHSIRQKLFRQILKLGPARLANSRSGEVRAALVEGVERLEVYFGKYLPQFFVAMLTPFVVFGFVSLLDWHVALVFLAAALFTLFAPFLFHRMDSKNALTRAKAYRKFAAEYLDSLQGLSTLKAFAQTKNRAKLLRKQADELAESTKWVLATNSLSRGITDTGIAVGAATALGVAAYRLNLGLLSFEALLMILMLGIEVFRPLRDLRALLHDGMLAESSAAQIFAVLEDQPLISEGHTNHTAKSLVPSIEFKQVSFQYPGVRAAVHNQLSFNIKVGERVAIVGSSGGGKSSIVRLLQRFYAAQQGSILIGGQDISSLSLTELRAQMAVVSQDTYLFHDSVEENLRLGKPDADHAEIMAACKVANAQEFIQSLPQGYATIIGERGLRLSGGQRQRIAIARALLRDAPILILDEALSSVDAENEAIIQQALDQLMVGRTTLILAHRLSSVIGADRILVLDQGRVCEQGTHQQLMENENIYHQLMLEQVKDRAQAKDPELILDANKESNLTFTENQLTPTDTDSDNDAVLQADDMSWFAVIKKLMSYAADWKAKLTLTFVLGISRVVAFIGVSIVSALAVAAVKNGQDYQGLLITLAALAGSAGILHWLESWVAHDMAFRMLANMRVELFNKLDALAPAFLLRRRSGDLVHLATEDIELIEYFFAHTIAPAFVALLVPTGVMLLLFSFHWTLALAIAPFLLAVACSPILFRGKIDELGSKARTVLGKLSAQTVELLQGLGEILSFQAEKTKQQQFQATTFEHQKARLVFYQHLSRHSILTELCTGLGVLAVIICAAPLVMSGQLDPAYVPLLSLAAMAAFLPVAEISDVGHQLADTLGATRRLSAVHNQPVTVINGDGQWQETNKGGVDVSFNQLSFQYPNTTELALNEINIALSAGKTTALVGPSGAGKSTFAHMLMRFWDPQQGTVKINGTDVKHYQLDELRKAIGIVAQETYLFNDSLKENLLIAKPNATEAELELAIERAELKTFVTSLPQGLATKVGESGYALSGGQRQRLSIARAFLKDAPVLILDEATSHLDSISERAVHKALSKLMKNRTTLIIAHRLSTVRMADMILVLEHGALVEAGEHEELLNNGGLYAHLINRQLNAGVAA